MRRRKMGKREGMATQTGKGVARARAGGKERVRGSAVAGPYDMAASAS